MPYNMDYCKFENTAGALAECLEAIQDGVDVGALSSDHERRGYKRLLKLVEQIYAIMQDEDEI